MQKMILSALTGALVSGVALFLVLSELHATDSSREYTRGFLTVLIQQSQLYWSKETPDNYKCFVLGVMTRENYQNLITTYQFTEEELSPEGTDLLCNGGLATFPS